MRKYLIHFGFIIPTGLFVLHQISQFLLDWSIPFIDQYLDPFCGSVIILHALAVERNFIFDQKLTSLDCWVAVIILAICSEVVFPYFSDRFTADYLDVIPFLLGGLWFILIRKDIIQTKEAM